MYIKDITLFNFRNYNCKKFLFEEQGSLITGKNGVGKTNLLEAISYSAFGKSIRQYADADLVNFDQSDFSIVANYQDSNRTYNYKITYAKNKKTIKLNNKPISRISDLYNYLKVVYFSADDIWLVNGNRQKRRSFFDQAITQTSVLYSDILREYYRILEQRNSILKKEKYDSQLKQWNDIFIKKAIELVEYRKQYLEKFMSYAENILNDITNSFEALEIEYETHGKVKYEQDCLYEYLDKIQEQEFENNRTLLGPHLDEYNFKINGYSVKRYSSQGQRRSLVISLRFAQIKMITESLKTSPIIIFDDALSELDKNRVDKILRLLNGEHQILIASPNIDNYRNFDFPVIDLSRKELDEIK